MVLKDVWDAEHSLVGLFIANSGYYYQAKEKGFSSEMITSPILRKVVEAMEKTNDFDLVTLLDTSSPLSKEGKIKVFEAYNSPVGYTNFFFERYLKYVRQNYWQRQMDLAYRKRDAEAIAQLKDQEPLKETKSLRPIAKILDDVMMELEYRAKNQDKILKTGLPRLDQLTGGLRGGRVYVIGGRTGTGKTTFLCNIAHNLIWQTKTDTPKILFISLEQSSTEIITSFLIREVNLDEKRQIPNSKFENPSILKDDDWEKIRMKLPLVKEYPLLIVDRHLTIENILTIMTETRYDVCFIDFLQMIRPSGEQKESRAQVLSDDITRIHAKAVEVGKPVIVASQMNREIEARGEDTEPKLSDLKSSGGIEETADFVAFLYEKEISKKDKKSGKDKKEKGLFLYIKKNRFGPKQVIPLQPNFALAKIGEADFERR